MSFSRHDFNSMRGQNPFVQGPSWRVLIAEDEALPAELLKRTLIRLGHTVVGSAENGVEAITLARSLKPDVIVMDLRMPVMDGWTATAELKRELLTPIVVVSALDDRESLEQAVFAGASAFLTKPVREADLERALELAVARFADMQEIRKWRADAEHRAEEQAAQTRELERVIQELREAQLQLLSAARRATVASLAHGLAHEINNALTPILGNAQIIKMLFAQDAEVADRAQQIMDHAQRIANWTASFRQVTTEVNRDAMPYSFNEIVREVMGLYGERLQRLGIFTATDLDESLPPLHGHVDQLQEVWMSLIQNAVEAMPHGGTLAVRTRFDSAAGRVIATLTDTGEGILPENLPHVFEPGFTTKGVNGRRSSLGWGLFTVKHVVRAHAGTVEIASPGEAGVRGTTVRIVLPVHSEPAPGTA